MGPKPNGLKVDKHLLLLLLYVNNREAIVGTTRFQKLVFLLQERIEDLNKKYEFEAYDYGPYSTTLHNAIDELVDDGLVTEITEETASGNEKRIYRITEKGVQYLSDEFSADDVDKRMKQKIHKIKSRYNHIPLLELLDRIYEQYPDYASNSKIYKY